MEALIVSPAEAGQKLLSFLERRLLAQPAEMHRWVRTGQVRLNGGRTHPFDRVAVNDSVRIPPFAVQRSLAQTVQADSPGAPQNAFSPAGKSAVKKSAVGKSAVGKNFAEKNFAEKSFVKESLAENNGANTSENHLLHNFDDPAQKASFPLAVHEDAELLVINKPSGLPTQGGSGHSDSVVSRLQSHFAGHAFMPAPAHRLDKDTSGLLLAAKTYATLRALHEALAAKSEGPECAENKSALHKEYLCWVQGYWPEAGQVGVQKNLVDFVRKGRHGEQERMEVCPEHAVEAKRAQCQATCLLQRKLPDVGPVSLVLVHLITGRTHQIRIQFSSRAFPLLGDAKYGYRGPHFSLKLHAFQLSWQGKTYRAFPAWQAPLAVNADIVQLA